MHGSKFANMLLALKPSVALNSRATSHQVRGASPLAMQAPAPTPAPWLPYFDLVKRPSYLDGSLPLDVGFDPLGLAIKEGPWWDLSGFRTPEKRVHFMREAEIKHSRLAMLAALGWPASELWHGPLSQTFNMPFELQLTEGRAPSVLNGNLGALAPLVGFIMLLSAYLEITTLDDQYGLTTTGTTTDKESGRVAMKSYTAGSLGFDPLNLYMIRGNIDPNKDEWLKSEFKMQWVEKYRQEMEGSELRHGRLAMLGITGFAIQEAILKIPVVDQTPFLFQPPLVAKQVWAGLFADGKLR